MSEILAYANPRRKRRHRRRTHRTRMRRRRNPEMLAIGNPRRRRRGRKRYHFGSVRRRAYRNPGGFGGARIPLLGYPVGSLVYLAVGATGTSFASQMILKFFPAMAPTATGQENFFDRVKPYLVDGASAFIVAKLGGMVFKSKQAEQEILTGGLAVPLLRLLRAEVFPRIGLSGPDDFDEADFMGLGYYSRPGELGFFSPEGTSVLQMNQLPGLGALPSLDDVVAGRRRAWGNGPEF